MKNRLLFHGLLSLVIATGVLVPTAVKADGLDTLSWSSEPITTDLQNAFSAAAGTSALTLSTGQAAYTASGDGATLQALAETATVSRWIDMEATVDFHLNVSLDTVGQYANLSLVLYKVGAVDTRQVSVGLNYYYDGGSMVGNWFGGTVFNGGMGSDLTVAGNGPTTTATDGSFKLRYDASTLRVYASYKADGDTDWTDITGVNGVNLNVDEPEGWGSGDLGASDELGFALVASSSTTTVSATQAAYNNYNSVPEPEVFGLIVLGSFCLILATQRKKETVRA